VLRVRTLLLDFFDAACRASCCGTASCSPSLSSSPNAASIPGLATGAAFFLLAGTVRPYLTPLKP